MSNTRRERLARGLGASRTVTLHDRSAQGPLGMLQLRAELVARLQSSGGRPTDPTWTLRRQVMFNPDRWHDLERLAERLSETGRKVSPAQLAALLVERGLADLAEEIERGGGDEVTASVSR